MLYFLRKVETPSNFSMKDSVLLVGKQFLIYIKGKLTEQAR